MQGTAAHLQLLLHASGRLLHGRKLAQGGPMLHLELAQLLPGFPLGPVRHVLHAGTCRLLPAISQQAPQMHSLSHCTGK